MVSLGVIILINVISVCLFSHKFTFEYVYHVLRNHNIYYNLTRKRFWVVPSLFLSIFVLFTIGHIYTLAYVLCSFWYFKDSVIHQLKIAIRHPLMNPEVRGLSYHIPLALSKNVKSDIFKYQNKIFWSEIFIKHEIFTPKIYGTIKNGILALTKNIDKQKNYIVKRIQDTGGSNAHLLDKTNLPSDSIYIIQDFMKSYKGIAENWRITTIKSNNNQPVLFNILLTINNNPKAVRTNCNTYYKNHEIVDDKLRYIKSVQFEHHNYKVEFIKKAINTAIDLHSKLENDFSCIGWDIIMTEKGSCFLEGNIAPGILRRNDVFYYRRICEYLDLMSESK